MAVKIEETYLKGAYVITPDVFCDNRGHFLESYNENGFKDQGITTRFVQDNQSASEKHVLRGFHFQAPPYAQAKLVRVASGSALDVIVDLRSGSPTFGKVFSIKLSGKNFLQVFVPEGFAHAFLTLEDNTLFQYKCNNFYNRASEGGIYWNDPALQVNWGVSTPTVSEKDKNLPYLSDFKTPFKYGK